MKRIFALLLAAVMAVSLAACSSQNGQNQRETLVVGLDDQLAPMGFRDADTNEIIGFDIDLAKEVAKRLDMDIQLQKIDWNSKEMELNNGNIDCIWNGLSVTPTRQEEMLLSKPYLANRMIVVVLKGSDIQSREDTQGKQVGVQKGSTALDALNADEFMGNGQVKTVEYADNVLALTDLKTERIDAVVMDEVVARYYANLDDSYLLLDDALNEEEYAIAFKKGNDELCQKVEAALADMIEDGTAAQISEKWFGEDILLK